MSGHGTVLFRALSAAHFSYSVRHLPDGTPYAGFRWGTTGLPVMSFTALEKGGELRITIHDLPDTGGSGASLWATSARVPLARLYRSPETRKIELCAAVDVEGATMSAGSWTLLLEHLGLSAQHLTGKLPEAPELPPLPSSAAPEEVPGALRAEGLDPIAHAEGFRFATDLPRLPVRARLGVGFPAAGWLRVEAEVEGGLRLPADRPDLADRLQWWAPVGRFTAAPSGDVTARVTVPYLERGTRDVLAAALRGSLRLLGTAWKHVTGDTLP